MTNFIPIFPLGIAVFPGEVFKLHIFEPRYKQLITECVSQKKAFGIPVVINNTVHEMGTLVQVTQVIKTWEDGKMDIEAEGLQVFRMLEQLDAVPEKLYSGAIVSYPENKMAGSKSLMKKIIEKTKELHALIKVSKPFSKPEELMNTYDIAHYAGLSLQDEYDFLQLMNELQRQEFLKRYLNKRTEAVKAVLKTEEAKGEMKEFMGFSLN